MVLAHYKPAGLWILYSVFGVLICTVVGSFFIFKRMLPRKYYLEGYIYCSMYLYKGIWIVPILIVWGTLKLLDILYKIRNC